MVKNRSLVFLILVLGMFLSLPGAAGAEEQLDPGMAITAPAAGDILMGGSEYTIKWTTELQGICQLYYSTDDGVTWKKVTSFGIWAHATEKESYTWTVDNATTTKARIKVSRLGGDSSFYYNISDRFTIVSGPVPPTELTATAASATTVNLSWTDNSNNETGFRIFRKAPGENYTHIDTVHANVTAYGDSGLDPGTTYYYKVQAYHMFGGNDSNEASATTETTIITPPGLLAPLAPTGLTATAASATTVNLSWIDNSNNEMGFRIFRKAPGENYTHIDTVHTNVTAYGDDSGLTAGTTYYYKVQVYNSNGSRYSNEAGATTKTTIVIPPGPVKPPVPAPGTPPGSGTGVTVIVLKLGSTEYTVNGQTRQMDAAPVSRSGRTLLPIRYVADPLGAELGWDGGSGKATVTLGDQVIEVWLNRNGAKINGRAVMIDPDNPQVTPITIPPGRTMLPLRFVAESLGCDVVWNGANKKITVTYPAN